MFLNSKEPHVRGQMPLRLRRSYAQTPEEKWVKGSRKEKGVGGGGSTKEWLNQPGATNGMELLR